MEVSFVTILLFFIYLWGLGFTGTYKLKKPENFFERNLMYLGIGLGIFSILSILLNFLHIPLDWKIFLLLSISFPIYILIKKIIKKQLVKPKFQITKTTLLFFAVLAIVLFSLFMYTKGAFSYPYLEDEDPWGHAVGAKYVAIEKTAYDPELENLEDTLDPILSYIDPYPPAYDVLMGILHQTSPDLNWTLKFFNALIISLGFAFFYLFANEFLGSRNKALLATLILAAIPSYLSHFIWATTLAITLFFPTMYAFERIKEDKKWWIIAAIMVAAIFVSQNLSEPIKLLTMIVIYVVVKSITAKKFQKLESLAIVGGLLLSCLWWASIIMRRGLREFIAYYKGTEFVEGSAASGGSSSLISKLFSVIGSLFDPGGTASRAYTFNDFFVANSQNMINTPIGIGIVLFILILVGVIYSIIKYRSSLVEEKNTWLTITLFWVIFAFWAVNGMTFPVSVARGAFRSWPYLAIAGSLIAVEGIYFFRGLTKSKLIKAAIVIVLIIGIILTTGKAKYGLNTAMWPTSGTFSGSPSEVFEYGAWFNSLEPNTNVFLYSPRDKITLGFSAYSCALCQDLVTIRSELLDKDAAQLHTFLKNNNYEFLVLNGRMDYAYLSSEFGENNTKELLPKRYDEIQTSGLFTPVYMKENLFIVFKVN